MIHRNFLNHLFRTLSPAIVSGIVLGSVLSMPTYGMEDAYKKFEKSIQDVLKTEQNKLSDRLNQLSEEGKNDVKNILNNPNKRQSFFQNFPTKTDALKTKNSTIKNMYVRGDAPKEWEDFVNGIFTYKTLQVDYNDTVDSLREQAIQRPPEGVDEFEWDDKLNNFKAPELTIK